MSDDLTEDPRSGDDKQSNDQAETESGQDLSGGEFSAGGKDFTSLEELRKAYSELQKGFTQKSQEYSSFRERAEKNQRAIDEIRSDPSLVDLMRNHIDSRDTGQESYEEGAPDTGLNARDRQKLARMELQFETQELRRLHPEVSEDELKDIYRLAADLSDEMRADVPLEHAYAQWAWKTKGTELYEKGLKDKEDEIKKGRSGSTSQPVSGGERTRTKFNSNAPGNERRNYIDKLFKGKGIDLAGMGE